MERVSISRLKDQLSAYLRKVQAGETVIVMDRSKPVAQLSPLPPETDDSKRIRELEAAGLLTPPKRPPLTLEELRRNMVHAPGARVLEALLEEREEEREEGR